MSPSPIPTPVPPAVLAAGRLTGAVRQLARDFVAERYRRGGSIRSIAEELGRAYGTTHRLLTESNVVMRSRGGSRVVAAS